MISMATSCPPLIYRCRPPGAFTFMAVQALDPALMPSDPAAAEEYRLLGVADKLLKAEADYASKLQAAIDAATAYAEAREALTESRMKLIPIQSKARSAGIPVRPNDGLAIRCASGSDQGWEA